jgi:hypothetical protein
MLDMERPFEEFWNPEIERFLQSPEMAAWRLKYRLLVVAHWDESIVLWY